MSSQQAIMFGMELPSLQELRCKTAILHGLMYYSDLSEMVAILYSLRVFHCTVACLLSMMSFTATYQLHV